jgi:hypothetical protein
LTDLIKTISGKAADAVTPPKENSGAAFLVASLTFVTGIFAALGITGGVLGRMGRNHPIPTGIAIFFATLAVISGVLAALKKNDSARQWSHLRNGLICFLVATIAAVVAGLLTWGDHTSPRVRTGIERTERGLILAIDTNASGLRAAQRLRVSVWPVTAEASSSSASGARYAYRVEGLPLFQSINGPNADGDVDLGLKVPMPPQHPSRVVVQAAVGTREPSDCFGDDSRSGCAVLYLGEPGRPQLSSSWSTKGKNKILTLQITDEDVPLQTLYLRVVGRAKTRSQLARTVIPPAGTGDVKQSIDVQVPARVHVVCAVASPFVSAVSACPPRFGINQTALRRCIGQRLTQGPLLLSPSDEPPPKETRAEAKKRCQSGQLFQLTRATTWIALAPPATQGGSG